MTFPPPTPTLVPSASSDGKKLIVPRGGALPANCVKCGAPADRPWKRNFRWHPSWMYILIVFPGILIYAIVALIVQKKMSMVVPLCEIHHGERTRYLIIGGILFVAWIPATILLNLYMGVSDTATAWISAGTFLASVVFLVLANRALRPTLIDQTHGEFTGACREFLDLLPAKIG